MAKNFFKRYIWLIDLLYKRGHATFEQISRAWAFSPVNVTGESRLPERTFFNHITAIEDIFDIVIKCNRTNGEYYIANTDDLECDGIRNWLLQSISLNNLLEESTGMRDRILFEKVPSSQDWLTDIIDAMRADRAVEMTYQSFRKNEPSTFIAHPYCLKLFKQRWYMLARSEQQKEPRIYSLDRIHNLQATEIKLKMPRKFDAEKFFENYFGIIVDAEIPVQTVKLSVEKDQVVYFRSLPLHHSQKEIETGDDYSIFEYKIAPTFDFKQEILSHGPSVDVIAPDDFKEEIQDDIARMASRYCIPTCNEDGLPFIAEEDEWRYINEDAFNPDEE